MRIFYCFRLTYKFAILHPICENPRAHFLVKMKKISLIALSFLFVAGCSLFAEEAPKTYPLPEKNEEVMALARETTDGDLLRFLATNANEGVRASVAKNPATPEDVLLKLVSDPSDNVVNYLAANPKADGQILTTLAKSEKEFVRVAVAVNGATPEDVLLTLVEDPSNNVQKKLAENVNLTDKVIRLMVEKGGTMAVYTLLDRPNLPPDVVATLKNHANEKVRKKAENYQIKP